MTAVQRHPRPARSPSVPVAVLDPGLRQARLEVLLWALRHGRPVHADALTVLLAAKAARCDDAFTLFRAETVRALLWRDVAGWCRHVGMAVPPRVPETLWTVLEWLAASDAFTPGSDPLPALREPLLDSAGLDGSGHPARPSAPPPAAAPTRSRRRHPSALPPPVATPARPRRA